MDLFFVRPGDIVVAKIDLKNGAVGILPEWKNAVVTGHFAVYEPDRSRVIPEYLIRIVQAPFFKAYLWRNKVGAEGRKEVKLDFFEAIPIPLPPLATQRAILGEWQKAQQAVAEAEERIRRVEVGIEAGFFTALGLKRPSQAKVSKYFAVPWEDFARWSVSYNQVALTGMDITKGKYPVVELGSALTMIQYGTSEKANTRGMGVPVLRMNNIVDGLFNLSAIKHIDLPEKKRDRLLLKDGDILFNRTNSKELVGKCAVFHESGQYIFASYLIRVRTKAGRASPDYVAFVLNSPIGRQQIDALSRQIIGQANVNSEELRSLRIPLPPLDVQRRIAADVEAGRAQIAREREAARILFRQIEANIEAYILGTREVGQCESWRW